MCFNNKRLFWTKLAVLWVVSPVVLRSQTVTSWWLEKRRFIITRSMDVVHALLMKVGSISEWINSLINREKKCDILA